MPSDTSWDSSQRFQNVLLIAGLSLSTLFLVNLYRARLRIIKLKTQGLVSRISGLC